MKLLSVLFIVFIFTLAGCSFMGPYQATDNPTGEKRGRACSHYLLGFRVKGENHIFNAAKAAQISKISTVDTRTDWFLVYWRNCTYVSGN